MDINDESTTVQNPDVKETVQVQTGWQWEGKNIISKDYTRIAFFPAEVGGSSNSYYRSKEVKEYTEDVSGLKTSWKFNPETDTLEPAFEVVIVHRNGSGIVIKTEIEKAKPYYETKEVPF